MKAELGGHPLVARLVEFIEGSKRGVIPGADAGPAGRPPRQRGGDRRDERDRAQDPRRGGGRGAHGPVPHPGPGGALGRRARRGLRHRRRRARSRSRRSTGRGPFRDHRELAGLVDFATVAVPTEQHFEVARDLLEAGAHVLVEKPMTPTLEEAKELFRMARQRGRVLHVGHVERFNGAVQELRKIVERPDPHRVPAARPLRAAGAERLGGDGPHDPRHRHRARPRGQRAAQDHRGRLLRALAR